jgi:hypothetical protein
MRRLWLYMRHATAVLLMAVVLGHAQLASACARKAAASQRMPCCPTSGQQLAELGGGCAGAAACLSDCAAVIHCACDQPEQTARASAPERSGDGIHLLAPVSPEPPVAAHQKPPPQGPPVIPLAALTGRHTYLATLRLRI